MSIRHFRRLSRGIGEKRHNRLFSQEFQRPDGGFIRASDHQRQGFDAILTVVDLEVGRDSQTRDRFWRIAMDGARLLLCSAIGGVAGSFQRNGRDRRRDFRRPFARLSPQDIAVRGSGNDAGDDGTSIGLLAEWTYYRQGFVSFPVAVGFVCGGLFGVRLAVVLSEVVLERDFAVTLSLVIC